MYVYTIKITGLKEFTKAMREAPRMLIRELDKAVWRSVLAVEREAKPITPFDTGYLRASIIPGRPLGQKDRIAMIAPYAPYAIYVHEGTRKWPLSKPPRAPGTVRQFMKKGAEKAEPDIDRYFIQALDKVIRHITK